MLRRCFSNLKSGTYHRKYYYEINQHGQLFLQETYPKNISGNFKDIKFLNFFFTRIKRNNTGEDLEYPYISPCGKELNLISCLDSPIVFTDLKNESLIWGGNLKFSFDPQSLSYKDGKLYHSSPLSEISSGLISSGLMQNQFADILDLEEMTFRWCGETYRIKEIQ